MRRPNLNGINRATWRRIVAGVAIAGALMALTLVVFGFAVPTVKATASTVGTGFFGLFDKKSESEPEPDAGQEAPLSMSTSTPTPKPTATPKPEKSSKKGKQAEEAVTEETERFHADGSPTDDEVASKFMAMSTQSYEKPEDQQERIKTFQQLQASGASQEEINGQVKAANKAAVLANLDAMEHRLETNPLFQKLRDVDGEFAEAYLYGFELYDSALSDAASRDGSALYGDAVSIPFHSDPDQDYVSFLWELAQRIARDPLYADMWCQTFDELYMYVYNVESEKWELLSVGKEVNPTIHQFFADDKKAMKALKQGKGEGPWYGEGGRLGLYGDTVVIEEESFKQMCVFGMLAASLQYLGTTNDTPAVYWANTRNAVPNEFRMTAKRTDGNPETKKWAKLGLVRKEESPVGAGLCEYEVWVNLTDGRTGIPGEPTVPNTAPPVPVRPENPYVPKPTPTPTNTPQGGPNPSVTPVPQVTATPIPTTPPQGGPNPSITPVPQVTATPIPTTPPHTPTPDTPTPVPTVPLKDPTQIIPDDHPNRIDSDGYDNPDETEDEEEDYVSPSDHTEGYTDSDGDEVGPSSEWAQGQPDEPWSYVYVEPTQAPVTPQREEVTDSEDDYETDNDGSSSSYEHYYEDEDGYWDAAPGTYTEPEDCNNNGTTADEEEQAIDDTEGYTYQPQTQSDITSPGGWHDQQEDTSLDGDSSSDGYSDYDF